MTSKRLVNIYLSTSDEIICCIRTEDSTIKINLSESELISIQEDISSTLIDIHYYDNIEL